MRIITGKARGIKLNTLEGENTRPTSERAKEAVFSMIQFDVEGREVLDLFAGSGQMGLEAVSRGAVNAVFVDKSRDAAKIITQNIEKTKLTPYCRVYNSDVNDFLRVTKGKKRYDVVFIDPPYAMRAVVPTLKALLNGEMLKSSSIIVCESEEADIFESDTAFSEKFEIIKRAKYGMAHITIIKPII